MSNKPFNLLAFIKKHIRNFLVGGVIGLANIIPGVSGGTMAVIFGVYDYLMEALGNFLTDKERRWEYIRFLIVVFLGAGIALLAFARVLSWSFEYYPEPTLYFFIGLIVGSIPVIIRSQKDMALKVSRGVALVIGIVIVVGLAVIQQVTEEQFEIPKTVSALQYEQELTLYLDDAHKAKLLDYYTFDEASQTYVLTAVLDKETEKELQKILNSGWYQTVAFYEYLYYVFCGMIAASAMIIPGVSGSFIMIILGIYWIVLSSLSGLPSTLLHDGLTPEVLVRLGLLGALGIGVVFGILVVSRFMSWCLHHYPSITMYLILGLVVGSLYQLFPGFSFDLTGIISLLTLGAGLVISLLLGGKKKKPTSEKVE
jgi:putative membrane protein